MSSSSSSFRLLSLIILESGVLASVGAAHLRSSCSSPGDESAHSSRVGSSSPNSESLRFVVTASSVDGRPDFSSSSLNTGGILLWTAGCSEGGNGPEAFVCWLVFDVAALDDEPPPPKNDLIREVALRSFPVALGIRNECIAVSFGGLDSAMPVGEVGDVGDVGLDLGLARVANIPPVFLGLDEVATGESGSLRPSSSLTGKNRFVVCSALDAETGEMRGCRWSQASPRWAGDDDE